MYMGITLYEQGFDGIFCFQNTGMETPETIDFLSKAPFPLTVLQYKDEKPFYTVETLESMNKTGEPFKQLVRKRKAIPNKRQRFCTQEMKIRTLRRYMRGQGILIWDSYVGIRADEPDRIQNITNGYAKHGGTYVKVTPKFPLLDWNVTAKEVGEFWRGKNWDLNMPLLPNGKTICGNCVGCFHKSEAELAITLKRYPALYSIMEGMEKEIGHTFREGVSMSDFRTYVENDLNFNFKMENDGYCTSETGSCGD